MLDKQGHMHVCACTRPHAWLPRTHRQICNTYSISTAKIFRERATLSRYTFTACPVRILLSFPSYSAPVYTGRCTMRAFCPPSARSPFFKSLSTMFSWNRCLYRGYTFSRFRYAVYLSFRFSKSGPFHVTSDCNRYCCGGGPLSGAEHPTDGNESLARRKIFLSTDISGSILPNELISRLQWVCSVEWEW